MKTNFLIRVLGAIVGLCAALTPAVNAQSGRFYLDLHDFGSNASDGAGPWSNVTFDGAGNMVGTTPYGGVHKRGTLWMISRSGSYVDLHDFGGIVTNANGTQGPDGSIPYGAVTFDTAGNMYGTAFNGGPIGNATGYSGMVWEYTKGGKYIDLHDFGGGITNANGAGGPDGGNPCSGVTLDKAGNLYGTASAGGPVGNGVDGAGMVWEITTNGNYLDLHDFGGQVTVSDGSQGLDGYVPFSNITFDSAGNMFGTASKGGPSGFGIVWKITKSGAYVDLHDFGPSNWAPNGETPYGGVTLDSTGNLYGTTVAGGINGVGTVWEITAALSFIDLHDFGGTVTNANGGTGPDGVNPYCSVVLDGGGNIFGTTAYGGPNTSAGIVWEIAKAGGYKDLHDFGGRVTTATGIQGPDGTQPWGGLAVDGNGNLFGVAGAGGPNSQAGSGSGMLWSLYLTQLKSLSIAPGSVLGGSSATGTVTLSAVAPWSGIPLPLTSNSSSVTVPASIVIPAGSTTTTFAIQTVGVDSVTLAVVSAGPAVGGQSATLAVNPPALTALSLNPTTIGGGGTSTGTVTLSGQAGPNGASVILSGTGSAASLPGTALVPAGQTIGTFTISTKAVATVSTASITATFGGNSKIAALTVTPAALAMLSVSPSSVAGGSPSTGTVGLSGNVFSGAYAVQLSSISPSVIVPRSVSIGAGGNSATFAIKTEAVAAQKTVTITAKSGATSKVASITLVPPVLTSLAVSPTTIAPGGSSTGTVTLSGLAPVGGMTVMLTSSSPKVTLPVSMKVPAGQTTAKFSIKASKSTQAGKVTISVTLNGVTLTSSLTIS